MGKAILYAVTDLGSTTTTALSQNVNFHVASAYQMCSDVVNSARVALVLKRWGLRLPSRMAQVKTPLPRVALTLL